MFPVSEAEIDRIELFTNSSGPGVILKSYGLPMIFWGYLLAIFALIGAMGIGVSGPLKKLLFSEDPINMWLAILVIMTTSLILLFLITAYFYEKFVIKQGENVTVEHRVFWLCILRKKYSLKNKEAFSVKHHLDSPNVARIQQRPDLKGFENRGYFELHAELKDGAFLNLDRHSRKSDLVKIKDFLSRY